MWSPGSSEWRTPWRLALAALAAGLVACSSTPPRLAPPPPPATAQPAPSEPKATDGTVPSAAPAAAEHPEVPDEARADFDRAVSTMRQGNASEAETGFRQLAAHYPQFAAPLVNLAILERKDGQLPQAEDTLKQAVARESGSAVAWTELGATQRMRGEFKDAADSYEHALSADPRYAPAWRNLGVLSDLYLGDPARALKAFEQYKEISGEDKPVSGWIAELRQRLGLPPVKRPQEPAPEGPASPETAPGNEPGATPTPGSAPSATPQTAPAAAGA